MQQSGGVAAPVAEPASPETDTRDPLDVLADLARALDAARVEAEADALAERVAEGRFYVACVGQFKRGKSTLLNALVGRPILPTGVVPVTATPTVVRYGDPPSALVRLADGETETIAVDEVSRYVAEEENPDNVRGVDAVEILLPAPLLRGGMCLVDTPGLGSVFEVATASTHDFVPHIDAALLVVGADPPISADEVALAGRVAEQVDDLMVVMTKADRVNADERAQAAKFTAGILEKRIGRPPGPIFEVSAAERLDGRTTRDWDRLLDTLHELSEESGRALVRTARERAVRRLASRLLSLVAEQRSLLTTPVEDLERRLGALRSSENALEERLLYLSGLFSAEQQRLAEIFARRRKEFLAEAEPRASRDLEEALDGERAFGPGFRRRAADHAREIGGSLLEPWLQEEEAAAEDRYREAADRLVTAANKLLDELAESGMAGVGELPHAVGEEGGFRTGRRYYLNRFEAQFVSPIPLLGLLDFLVPPPLLRRWVRKKATGFLRQILRTNTTRVRSDLIDRVVESRRGLERELRSILQDARDWTEGAIRHAEEVRAEGQQAVGPELDRLDEIEARLRALLD